MDEDVRRWKLAGAERADAGIVVHAPDTALLWANEKASALLGISRDELTGKLASDPSFRLTDATGAPLSLERYPVMMALETREPVVDLLVGVVHAEETATTWVMVSANSIFEGGKLVAVVVTFVDVTALRRARDELALSEERFASAVAGTNDGLWDLDVESDSVWFAPRFEQLLGFEPGTLEPTGAAWESRIHPDDLVSVREALEAHLERAEELDVQYRIRHACGRWIDVRSRGRAYRREGQRGIRVAGALSDVTEQLHAARERERVEKQLESTARLESLAVLAGGVAHDFNNLLVGVLGAAEACRHALDRPQEATELLDVIQHSAERAAELTRQLMAYAGRTPVVLEVLSPAREVEELARLIRGALPLGTELILNLAPDAPSVEVDPTQLRQVVLNLLINGAEALEGGAGSVRVTVRGQYRSAADLERLCGAGPPGPYATIVVEDDGVGMDPETAARIFEPFFTTKCSGHGLGLAAVHGMIRAHAGYVVVASQLGVGTRFELGLPASERTAVARGRAGSAERAWPDGARAVLVEDDDLVRRVTTRLLQLEGWAVEPLPDGRRLFEELARSFPTMLVVDITLPGESGTSLWRRVRVDHPTLPVVLMSGHVDVADRLDLSEDPYTVFMAKPFKRDALRAALGELFGSRPSS